METPERHTRLTGPARAITVQENGANVNVVRQGGFTPLYCATYRGHVDCMARLLRAPGVHVDSRTQVSTKKGESVSRGPKDDRQVCP